MKNYVSIILKDVADFNKEKWSNFSNCRDLIKIMLADQNFTLLESDAKKLQESLKDIWFISYTLSRVADDLALGRGNLNTQSAVTLLKPFCQGDERFLKRIKQSIAELLHIKHENCNPQFFQNVDLMKEFLFSSKEDLLNYIVVNSLKSLKIFSSLMNIFPHHLTEKDNSLVLSRIQKILKNRVANQKNTSIISKALHNPEIFDWISKDSSLRESAIRFIEKMNIREIQLNKMFLGKKILEMYSDDISNLHLLQDSFISKICCAYYRFEKRILQILQVKGTSPRKAFKVIVDHSRSPSFLCNKYPELSKLQLLI